MRWKCVAVGIRWAGMSNKKRGGGFIALSLFSNIKKKKKGNENGNVYIQK